MSEEWLVALRLGKRRLLEGGGLEEWFEKTKASLRAKSLPPTRSGVEHLFLGVKRIFGYDKVRYRGLAQNQERLAVLLGNSQPDAVAKAAGSLTQGAVCTLHSANPKQRVD